MAALAYWAPTTPPYLMKRLAFLGLCPRASGGLQPRTVVDPVQVSCAHVVDSHNNTVLAIENLPAGTEVGDYVVHRRVGEGGFAVVYEGEHRALKKRVAIKLLLPHQGGADVVQRFVREGEAAARLEHPNVVNVVHVGTLRGLAPYLVMEFLEGEDLAAMLKREHALPPQQLADIMLPVFSAVAAAHDADIIHRDLKPENIFLCRDRRGRITPKVLDFGISKLSTEAVTLNLTASDAILGTPYYMSPEQAEGARSVDARSDVFALGVILYEASTGQRPFVGDSLYGVLSSIVVTDPSTPREIAPAFDPRLEEVILQALRKRPEERFQSVRALGRALLPFASQLIQINYEQDFLSERNTPSPVVPAPVEDLALAQTASASPRQPASPSPRRGRTVLALTAGLLCIAAGAWWFSDRDGQTATGQPVVSAHPDAPVAHGPTPVPSGPLGPDSERVQPAATSETERPDPALVVEPEPVGHAAVDHSAQARGARATPTPETTGAGDGAGGGQSDSMRTVRLIAEPRAATLTVDGELIGRGEANAEIPVDGKPHRLVVAAAGYVSREVSFTHDDVPGPIRLKRRHRRVRQDRPVPAVQAATAPTPASPRDLGGRSAAPAAVPEEGLQMRQETVKPSARRGANDALILP